MNLDLDIIPPRSADLLSEHRGRLQPLFRFERLLPSTHTAIMRDVGSGIIPVTIGIGSWGGGPAEEWTGQAPATLQYGIPVSVIEQGGMDICVAGCPRDPIHLTGDKVTDSKFYAPNFAPIGTFVKAAMEEMRRGKNPDQNPGFPTWSESDWMRYLKELWQKWDLRVVTIKGKREAEGTKLSFDVYTNPGTRVALPFPRILVADANGIVEPETGQPVNIEGVDANPNGTFDSMLMSAGIEKSQPAPDALLISIEPDISVPKSTAGATTPTNPLIIDGKATLVG